MDYSPWGHKVSDTTIKQHYFWLFLDAGGDLREVGSQGLGRGRECRIGQLIML